MEIAKVDSNPYNLAIIQSISTLLSNYDGPLKIQLDPKSSSGRKIVLSLTCNQKTILQLRLDKLLRWKKGTKRSNDDSNCRTRKRKRKRKRNRKKSDKNQIAPYDWSKHGFEVLLKEFAVKDEISAKIVPENKKGNKKKKKRSKKKTKKKKRKKKKKRTSKDKSRKGKKTKSSKQPKRPKYKDRRKITSRTTTEVHYGASSLQKHDVEQRTNFNVEKASAVSPDISTPKRSNTYQNRPDFQHWSSNLPSISTSDLRSPLTWEKRRQSILQKSKRSGNTRISAISLTNPIQTANGYFFATNNISQASLEETLKRGAFVYRTSRKESKMNKWRAKLARRTSSYSELGDPSSSPSNSTYSMDSPPKHFRQNAPIEPDPSSQPEFSPWLEFDPQFASFLGGAALVRGSWEERSTRGEARKPPKRSNTLHQIRDLEMFDASTASERESEQTESKDGSRFQTSSFGSARVTGEDDLWSYSVEEPSNDSWLGRLRDKFVGLRIHF